MRRKITRLYEDGDIIKFMNIDIIINTNYTYNNDKDPKPEYFLQKHTIKQAVGKVIGWYVGEDDGIEIYNVLLDEKYELGFSRRFLNDHTYKM